MPDQVTIHWFRKDLRLMDNPALSSVQSAPHLLPIYILDIDRADDASIGEAGRWWLHHALVSLNSTLKGTLQCYRNSPLKVFEQLIQTYSIEKVVWNISYEPIESALDIAIQALLRMHHIEYETFNGTLLWSPECVQKLDGSPYKVFTPFYKKGCLGLPEPRAPIPQPKVFNLYASLTAKTTPEALDLCPRHAWHDKLQLHWVVSESAAHERLDDFIEHGLNDYKLGRNYPARDNVSRLSPYLRWGQISPHVLWHRMNDVMPSENVTHFCSELGWREFSYYQLHHHPDLNQNNLQSKFDSFPWSNDSNHLKAWQQGQTGIPMVDAGMRELWETGYMHNRSRMIVGSFLVKNLRIDWRLGMQWFWNTLVDADLANNSAGWQWIAGCGADAAPYFRIFNPVTQGQKFDPQGDYVRRFVPELALLPDQYLFSPWEAPALILKAAQVELGVDYPKPIVDLKISREKALSAFKSLKSSDAV
ncbi:MAG: deoxyribodipyrimidine photolyase [Legionellales bacterium]|nr:deoxyribodipyrimidine photolyase [Legionellales bacterium]